MQPKTAHQAFIDWLAIATIDELETELLDLGEINLSILSQIEKYDLRIKTIPPTPENEDWKLRASHSQRTTYYQIKTIERKIVSVNQGLAAQLRSENANANAEAARLKHERSLTSDRIWIEAALKILDAPTVSRISSAAGRVMEQS